jgi:hypothetical protein
MVILGSDSGLPDLPSANIAIYFRKKSDNAMIPAFASFLVKSFAALKSSLSGLSHDGSQNGHRNSRQKPKAGTAK